MKRSSDYLNEISKNVNIFYELSEKEHKDLKSCLLSMYKDLKYVCDKHNLVLMLGGGSALGAVRHQGFIPWDDDLDLLMPRDDYEKLIDLFDNELGNKYYYSAPNRKQSAISTFLKIYKKNTLMKTYNSTDEFKGVLIDVFPIDNVPNNLIKRFIKSKISFLLRSIAFSVKSYQLRNENTKKIMNQSCHSYIYYYACQFVGFIHSFKPFNFWLNIFDYYVREKGNTRLVTIPTGRALYSGEMLPNTVFFPPSEGFFQGHKIFLPHDTDTYLTNLYGDYMKIPPKEKRERHFYINFNLDADNQNI